jgi:murein DD-endopeptidase MepM/ murein hydrolase activator NlpD
MNIIIVGKPHSAPRNIDLQSGRGRLLVAGTGIAVALAFGVLGFVMASLFGGTQDRTLREVRNLRATIAAQQHQLGDVRADTHRSLDALAVQLGKLQAQAARLNALGERLTQVGRLDDGEFDFSATPAMGGPEEPVSATDAPVPLVAGIDSLRAEFERQDAQLSLLENLLLERKVDNALLPTGMPVKHGYIASGYGVRTDPINGHRSVHRGIDFDAPMGAPVLSVAEGVVTFAGVRHGYGKVVEVDHGNGYMTRYAHNSKIEVKVGQRVHIGDTLAKVGSTGRSTGPHCHFEVWLDGRPVNPIAYVKSKRTQLL